MKNEISIALKGFAMGAANLVPGVSGGTIALLTGIYSRLIEALNALMAPAVWKLLLQRKWKEFFKSIDGPFLLSLGIGVVLSILILAKLMEFVMLHYPVQTWAFFFGLIIASSVFMIYDLRPLRGTDFIPLVLGAAAGATVFFLSPTQTPDNLLFIFLCGAIAICTMILPGISGSFVLVILGKYEYIMSALSSLNIPVLVVFALGCAAGILAFAKFLRWLLSKAERATLLALTGFVIGSLVKVWPWNDAAAVAKAGYLGDGLPLEEATRLADAVTSLQGLPQGWMHIGSACLWAVLGVALIVALELLAGKKG